MVWLVRLTLNDGLLQLINGLKGGYGTFCSEVEVFGQNQLLNAYKNGILLEISTK